MKISFSQNRLLNYITQCLLIASGIFGIMHQAYTGHIDMLGNPWNARLYMLLMFALISLGMALPGRDTIVQLKRFCLTFGLLAFSMFLFGGILLTNDALNQTTHAGGNAWVAFDVMSDITETTLMITQATVIIVPVSSMAASVMFIFDADTTEEKQSVLIEIFMVLMVLVAYGWIGSYFNWYI